MRRTHGHSDETHWRVAASDAGETETGESIQRQEAECMSTSVLRL